MAVNQTVHETLPLPLPQWQPPAVPCSPRHCHGFKLVWLYMPAEGHRRLTHDLGVRENSALTGINCQGLVRSPTPCCLSQSSTLVELAPVMPLLLVMNEEAASVSVWGTVIQTKMSNHLFPFWGDPVSDETLFFWKCSWSRSETEC